MDEREREVETTEVEEGAAVRLEPASSEPERAGTLDGFDLTYPKRPRKPPVQRRKARGPLPLGYGDTRVMRRKKAPPESLFTLDWAFRDIGGREGAIALTRLLAGTEPRLAALLDAWKQLDSSTRKHSPRLLEKLCHDAELDPAEYLGLCAQAMHRYQFDAARLLANLYIEDIVQAGAERAIEIDGTEDRKLIYQHMRFLPERGPAVAVQVNTGQGQQSLPDFKNLAEIALLASRKELPAPTEEGVIDVSYNESEPEGESGGQTTSSPSLQTKVATEDLLG